MRTSPSFEAIEDRQDNVITERMAHSKMWRPLEVFSLRKRCNCGRVLRFSPWLDGVRVMKCEGCGWKSLEAVDDGEALRRAGK